MWHWASYLTFLGLTFFIYGVGIIIEPYSWLLSGFNDLLNVNCLAACLAHSKDWTNTSHVYYYLQTTVKGFIIKGKVRSISPPIIKSALWGKIPAIQGVKSHPWEPFHEHELIKLIYKWDVFTLRAQFTHLKRGIWRHVKHTQPPANSKWASKPTLKFLLSPRRKEKKQAWEQENRTPVN